MDTTASTGKNTQVANTDFIQEYSQLMEGYNAPFVPGSLPVQWQKPGDFFVQLSLYDRSVKSITSAGTSTHI